MTVILESYISPLGFALDSIEPEIHRRSKITRFIHFAAHKAVGESTKQPLKYYANNVLDLIDFCSLGDFGIKNFVFSSSATVYGTVSDIGLRVLQPRYYCIC
jgi:UDP-glucose 4-epimerase